MVNIAEPGNRHACAACKHQRKKCKEDCVLALYFPGNRSEEFQSIHKIFGVSNLSKILQSIEDEGDRKEVVKSIIWEAKMWAEDPVQGPLGAYTILKRELELLKIQENQRIARQPISPYVTDLGLIGISTTERRESGITPNKDDVIAALYYSNTNQNNFMHREEIKGQALNCIPPPPSYPYVPMAAEGQERVSRGSGIIIPERPVALAEPPGRRQTVGCSSSITVPMEQRGIRASQGSSYATTYNTVYDQQQGMNYQGNYKGIFNNTNSSSRRGQEEEAQRGGVCSNATSDGDAPPLVEEASQVKGYSPYPYNTFIQKHEMSQNYDSLVVQQQHVYAKRKSH